VPLPRRRATRTCADPEESLNGSSWTVGQRDGSTMLIRFQTGLGWEQHCDATSDGASRWHTNSGTVLSLSSYDLSLHS
jgi:hypothetical protein